MEAFGAVVNICSFIDLSAKLIVKLNKYIFEVKTADDTSKRFAKELRRMVEVLKAFKSLVDNLDQQASLESKERLATLKSFFEDLSPQTQNLYEDLVSFSEWLDKETRSPSGMGFFQKMKWPSKGRKAETVLQELSRHIGIFNLALSVDSRQSLKSIGCIVQSSQDNLREILRECKELQTLLHLSQTDNLRMYLRLSEMHDHADTRRENSHCETNASFERIETNLQDGRREACHNFDDFRRGLNVLQSDNVKIHDHLTELKGISLANIRGVHDYLDRIESTALILPKSIRVAIESLKNSLRHEQMAYVQYNFPNISPSVCDSS